MEQVCLSTPESWGVIITGAVTVFSVLVNLPFIRDSAAGKIFQWLALNITAHKKVEK